MIFNYIILSTNKNNPKQKELVRVFYTKEEAEACVKQYLEVRFPDRNFHVLTSSH
jgi:hypothetical protein